MAASAPSRLSAPSMEAVDAPPRVVHLLPSSPYGGMQRLVAQLAQQQLRGGMDVVVVGLYESRRLAEDLEGRDVPYRFVGRGRPDISALAYLPLVLRRLHPTIVHLHGGLLWSSLSALVTGTATWIGHVHSYPLPPACRYGRLPVPSRPKERLTQALWAHRCQAFIAVSHSVGDSCSLAITRHRKPVYVVHNGVEIPRSQPRETHAKVPPIYGMATRFAPDKGLVDFLEVAAEIVNIQPGARFALAGDGPCRPQVLRRIRDRGLTGRVALLGHVVDIDEFWRSIDVAVFTAPREGFGLRILEPMALGVPVVGYRTGAGSDEVMVDGRTALLASSGNPRALAEASVRLSTDARLSGRLRDAAYEHVRDYFNIDRMAREIHEVYNRTLRGSGVD